MKQHFKVNAIKLALCLAYPALSVSAQAACDDPDAPWSPECEGPSTPVTVIYNPLSPAYPSLPPTLAPAVKPNILMHVDNSGSMGSTVSGSKDSRMTVAKQVATELVTNNRDLNWGLFSFDYGGNAGTRNSTYYNEGGVLQRPVLPIDKDHETNFQALLDTIKAFTDYTNTPLGETMVEMTRVWAGEPSYYIGSGSVGSSTNTGKQLNTTREGTTNKYVYTSPIQYRCQRNFNIVITDGDPTQDSTHAGITNQYVPGYGNTLKYTDGISWQQRDVAGGPLVSKNFKVCENKDTASIVGCNPHTYASSGGTKSYSTGGAVQDAAKYAYMRDFKVEGLHGVDGDGKSWDDPKYPPQNVITYTVGFAIDKPSLASAALVGGGKYYTAENKAQLTAALNNAITEIGNITSNAGGAAADGASLSTADKVFQPVFHPTGWYGELRCFKLNAADASDVPCDNPKADFPAPGNRNIVSANVDGGGTNKFAFIAGSIGSMTTEQQTALGANTTERTNVINFIRGQNVSGFRTRPNGILGDIIDGQPLVVGVPSGQTTDTAYTTFKTAHGGRSVVYIGANDGMLHAFATKDMIEIFGFVPSPVYPKLKTLTATNYGTSLDNPHAYHVNGVLRQQDLKLGSWMTLLVGGLAQGGQGWFALNATNPTATSKADDLIKWEFTDKSDPDLGYTFGAPIIYNIRTSTTDAVPVVLLPNGYKSDYTDGAVGANNATLFIVHADNGALQQAKITAPSGWGLSSPAGVDFPADGVLDYVYAGDQSGRLWRFDLTATNGIVPTPQLVFAAGAGHPIIERPVIQVVKDKDGKFLGNLVIFGTGSLLEGADRLDNTTQTMYGVLDRADTNGDLGTTTLGRADLAQRLVEEAVVSGGDQTPGTYRRIYPADSAAPPLDLTDPTSAKLGWFLDLPVLSERLAATPYLLSDRVLFGTGIPNSQEVCNTGYGWLMAVNPLTGLVVQGSRSGDLDFYDVMKDGRSTTADKVQFGADKYFISGVKLDGIPTELLVVVQSMAYATFAADNPFAVAAANMAFQDSNASGVFDGTSVGTGQGGFTQLCMIGIEKCIKVDPPREGSGVRIETTIWREIKK
ncbi:MAG: hypothetical protein LBE62_06585 [Azonexus sp.]|nr:hypothetical protein [Azonexus sp.]